MWYFYVLKSLQVDNWFYKGSTNDLIKRVKQHNDGEVQSTEHYRSLKLVYYEAYLTETAARKRESSVKKSGSVWKPLMDRIKQSLR
ncbi:MAG: GIY-YIG nuclease family protein [Patescibacteria group bacterium]